MSAQRGVLSASERKAFLAALDDPMTDDEAVGLIAELVTLTAAVSKVATQEQQKALLPTLLRAGNMVPYIAERLKAVAELVEADKEYDAANAAWTEAQVNSTGDENPAGWREEAAKQWQRFGEASRRRAAAIARMDPQPGEES